MACLGLSSATVSPQAAAEGGLTARPQAPSSGRTPRPVRPVGRPPERRFAELHAAVRAEASAALIAACEATGVDPRRFAERLTRPAFRLCPNRCRERWAVMYFIRCVWPHVSGVQLSFPDIAACTSYGSHSSVTDAVSRIRREISEAQRLEKP